jgi:Ig-like domain from next to BRCA1 gene
MTAHPHHHNAVIPLSFVAILSAILACSMPGVGAPTPTNSVSAAGTSAAQTVAVLLTQSAVAPTLPSLATPTALPSNTSVPPTLTPSITPVPCNRADFVNDVNYPDNSTVLAGTSFTKTWRLINSGSCTWTSGYSVVFVHGDRMSAPDSVPVTSGTIASGAQVDVSVPLVAPGVPGTYKGDFMLRSSDGTTFGIGPAGDSVFWIKIVVPAPTSTPTPTITPTLLLIPSLIVTLGPLLPLPTP